MVGQNSYRQRKRFPWVVVAISALLWARAVTAQNAATPPVPPSSPAPPSATIPNPGQPQFSATPVILMNAPSGQAGAQSNGQSTGIPGASILVVPSISPALQPSQDQQLPPAPATVLPAGTKVLLSLKSAINTRLARVGDAVYLQSSFPVVADGRVLLPAGVYVQGKIDAVRPAGRGGHRAEVRMHCTTMVLQNGTVVSFLRPQEKVPSQANSGRKGANGTVPANGKIGSVTETVARNSAAGVGASAQTGAINPYRSTRLLSGCSVGAVCGPEYSIFAKENEFVIPKGTSLEMVLQRPLVLQSGQGVSQPSPAGASPNYAPSPIQPQPMQ